MSNKQGATFEYDKNDVEVLALALEKAFKQVGCNIRCFDWLNYSPDSCGEHKITS